jgi:hypothetical protein
MTDEIDAELSDIERMKEENQHLKRVIGDQGNQIGDLRKLVTESLPKEDDWDYDPQERELQSLKSEVGQIKQAEALRQLEQSYPGFRELPKNKEFLDWIQDSPVRADLYRRADSMDFNAAQEMLSLWREREKLREEMGVQVNTQRRQALKDATMEKGSAGGTRTKMYSRQELIDMRRFEPDKFSQLWPEIQKAYTEGRVK